MLICVGKQNESHWIIDSDKICIYEKKQGLFTKPRLSNSCTINEISYINVYWKNILMGKLLKYAHPIFFTIHLKDGTTITFEAMLGTKRDEFIKAIEYLESYNIIFKSHFDLINKIKDIDINIWQCIEDIIAENNLSMK